MAPENPLTNIIGIGLEQAAHTSEEVRLHHYCLTRRASTDRSYHCTALGRSAHRRSPGMIATTLKPLVLLLYLLLFT